MFWLGTLSYWDIFIQCSYIFLQNLILFVTYEVQKWKVISVRFLALQELLKGFQICMVYSSHKEVFKTYVMPWDIFTLQCGKQHISVQIREAGQVASDMSYKLIYYKPETCVSVIEAHTWIILSVVSF